MEATIYYEDERIEKVSPKNGKDFKLKELQAIVKGKVEITPCNGRLLVRNEYFGKFSPNISATVEWIKQAEKVLFTAT